MFSDPYKEARFFGVWAEESAGQFGRRDALAVLCDAVERSFEQDMKTPDVSAALDYLRRHATRSWPFDQFRRALNYQQPAYRQQALTAAYEMIERYTAP